MGEDGIRLASELEAAMAEGLQIKMAHEKDEDRSGCAFSTFSEAVTALSFELMSSAVAALAVTTVVAPLSTNPPPVVPCRTDAPEANRQGFVLPPFSALSNVSVCDTH
jgi:hypothetical protein|eukprot:6427877-Prymnesium_polylepis.1